MFTLSERPMEAGEARTLCDSHCYSTSSFGDCYPTSRQRNETRDHWDVAYMALVSTSDKQLGCDGFVNYS